MGTTYSVACRDCRVWRDLDKFYAARKAENRKEAIDIADYIKETHSFRSALLVSFLWEHSGHNCTLYNEHADDDMEMEEQFTEDDKGWWRPDPGEERK